MRLIHTADWHFGRTLEGRSRHEEHAAFVDELARIADETDADAVLIAGDVYDSVNPPADAEKLFYEALKRLSKGGRRPVAAIAGNHDHPERLSAAAPLAVSLGVTLLGLPSTRLVTLDAPRTGERALLYAIPYPSESRLGELLAEDADEAGLQRAYSERIGSLVREATSSRFGPKTINLIMSHLYALGGTATDSERPIEVGGAYTVHPSAFGAEAQYVALGHLHRPQNVGGVPTDGRPLVRYSGSPLAFSFSEAGQAKSVTVLDLKPGGAPEMEEIPLSCGRPLTVWKAKEGLAQAYAWIEEGRDRRSWIDLELHLTEAIGMDDIQRLRRAHEGIVHIRPVYRLEQESEMAAPEAALPIDELFRRFYAKQTGGAVPGDDLIRLFLELVGEEKEAERA